MISFDTIPTSSFQGAQIAKQNVKLRGENEQPGVVQIPLDWSKYVTATKTTGVALDLNGVLGTILSIYIDNRGLPYGVYVVFPDTDCTVYCPANRQIFAPVFTSGVRANCFLDMSDVVPTALPNFVNTPTVVYFNNYPTFPNNFESSAMATKLTRLLYTGTTVVGTTFTGVNLALQGNPSFLINYARAFIIASSGSPTLTSSTLTLLSPTSAKVYSAFSEPSFAFNNLFSDISNYVYDEQNIRLNATLPQGGSYTVRLLLYGYSLN